MNLGLIITLTTLGILLLAILGVVLYFVVFKQWKLKKDIKSLRTKFERSHGILFGQDTQYIRRLEAISSTNLVYVNDFGEFKRLYRDICEYSDNNASNLLMSLEDMVSERRFKEVKAALPNCKKEVDDFENSVTNLDNSLRRKFKEEENCHSLAYEQRESFRQVKQEYHAKQSDLTLVSQSLETVFSKIEMLFENVDTDIENARYLDAKTLLANDIAPVISSLSKIMKKLPSICISLSTVLPEKIMRLNRRYNELSEEKYPLAHIIAKEDIDKMNDQVKRLSNQVQGLNLKGVDETIDAITRSIDEDIHKFEEEISARAVFERDCDDISGEETALQGTFINLCHALPKLKKIYLIDEEEQKKIDEIQELVNKAGASKRGLDAYSNSVPRQPYTVLVAKMKDLENKNNEAKEAVSALEDFLSSLKKETEEAFSDLSEYYISLRNCEVTVRHINIPAITKRFGDIFTSLHSQIDDLNASLNAVPIDVKKIKEDHERLKSSGDEVFRSVESVSKDLASAEKAIVKMNSCRRNSIQVDNLLSQAERLFYSGDFKHANESALEAQRAAKEIG